jgi:hypothetical protein
MCGLLVVVPVGENMYLWHASSRASPEEHYQRSAGRRAGRGENLPVVSLVAVPIRQVSETVAQADDGVEAALGNDVMEVLHQAQPVGLLNHPADSHKR